MATPDKKTEGGGTQDPAPSTSATPMLRQTSQGGGSQEPKSPKGGVQIRDPPVSETRGYSVVKVEDKHGPLYNAIPVMPLPLAVLCCVLNIVLPGVGTLLSSLSVFCCGPTRIDTRCKAFGFNLLSAFLQMISFLLIVGWIWSIRWGMIFVQMALAVKNAKNVKALPYYVRRQSSLDYQKQTSKHSAKG